MHYEQLKEVSHNFVKAGLNEEALQLFDKSISAAAERIGGHSIVF